MALAIMAVGLGLFAAMTFLGTWLLRGRGVGELLAWGRPRPGADPGRVGAGRGGRRVER